MSLSITPCRQSSHKAGDVTVLTRVVVVPGQLNVFLDRVVHAVGTFDVWRTVRLMF